MVTNLCIYFSFKDSLFKMVVSVFLNGFIGIMGKEVVRKATQYSKER